MNEATTVSITGAVRAATNPSMIPAHHPSQFVPRPALHVVAAAAHAGTDASTDDEQVWAELERMLIARDAARALHPSGRGRQVA